MKKRRTPKKGGLIMKRDELSAILEQNKIVGLAFARDKSQNRSNVALKLFKVQDKDGQLVGVEVENCYMRGASDVHFISEKCEMFQFQYKSKMKKDNFDFAYLPKGDFTKLFIEPYENYEEVFISGAKNDYGQQGSVTKEWFTLKIEPRKVVNLSETENVDINIRSLGSEPKTTVMKGCPPQWTSPSVFTEDMQFSEQIVFQRSDQNVMVNT